VRGARAGGGRRGVAAGAAEGGAHGVKGAKCARKFVSFLRLPWV
jgi:hypothetical protein